MVYPKETTVRTWLAALQGLNVRVKKMFGCYCLYCDEQPVGWLSGEVLSLREVGLSYLPPTLKRPAPGDAVQEIVIPLEYCGCEWLPRAVQDTARLRKAAAASPSHPKKQNP
ncbi:MAG TPA: TfoX/Sxy family protein [Candidatus Gemmiger excrementigallinarum]|uniref:TfoX/Sxy family protein n=1 Tax=Candidatus Gemmiger excrementigallinarum TaxID=2838609 RepID=A0A9D2JAV9_9FIRM|nr:TfoX/Sxy family protein [Candidatus Gemmiger excrementigallinarum]